MSNYSITSFWFPHTVRTGDTLRNIALNYRFPNPGPIVAFNADRFPKAVESYGPPAKPNPDWNRPRSRNNRRIDLSAKTLRRNAQVSATLPLQSNQINQYALSVDHAGFRGGIVYTIRSRYPFDSPLSPDKIPFLEIPWNLPAIDEFISTKKKLRANIIRNTHAEIGKLKKNLNELQGTLFAVDFMAVVLTGFAGIGKLAVTARNPAKIAQVQKEILRKLIMRAISLTGKAVEASTLDSRIEQATLELPKKLTLKKDLKFVWNNTIGWISPSKWTGVAAAIVEKDSDIAWWGAEAIDVKTRNRIIKYAEKRVDHIDESLRFARLVRNRSFYKHRMQNA